MSLLEAFGMDPQIIQSWEARYGPTLLPVQERAVKEYGLLQGGDLVVFAPTTSGKTFIGELLAVASARRGRRVLYLVPTKALAEEKFAQFQAAYRPVGLVTAISSRDHREWDEAILTKAYDLAVIVYEKLQALLVTRPSLLEEVGVVIIDELQMLGDEERGPTIEILLTKILQARIRPQLLGLSAVLGQGEELARWLGAKLLIEEKRPVELRKGVFCRGVFTYQEHNTRLEGEETWTAIDGENEVAIMARLARHLGQDRGESTLLFVKDKPTVEAIAQQISDQVSLPEAREAIDELLAMEETASREFLLRVLKTGVGIHHADLPWEQRELMERAFRQGAIRILCSTSTLAMGINCPAKNVLIESRQWHYYPRYNKMDTRDLPRALYENMAGRGGRYGYVNDFGRAILVTHAPFKRKVWMDRYVNGTLEPLEPALKPEDIREFVVNLIASGHCATASDLVAFLRSTYTAFLRWKEPADALEPVIQSTLEMCRAKHIIRADGDGRFTATELGLITALKGIRLGTCLGLEAWMRQTTPANLTDLEILYALALTEDAQDIYIPLPARERRHKNYRTRLRREVFAQQEQGKPVFQSLLGPMQTSEAEEASAIKKALLLLEWITPKATSEIEQSYLLHSGAIRRIGEEFSWLAEAASAIAKATGWPDETAATLAELSERVVYGVTAQGLALSKIRLRGLGRTYIARLVREGFDTTEAIAQLSIEVLSRHLPARLAQQLYAHVHPELRPITDVSARREPAPAVSEASAAYEAGRPDAGPTLALDPTQHRVWYRGIAVPLSFYPFKMLAALARTPGQVVTKADLYDAVYRHADATADDERPYERQLSDHKRKIAAQIRKAVSGRPPTIPLTDINHLITVKRRVGYCLNLAAAQISVIGDPSPRQRTVA